MFDIGFWELGVIGVVALLVVGPERLPALARSAGLWVGRLRRIANGFREDLERELRAEELKRSLIEERDALVNPVRKIGDELRTSINDATGETALRGSVGTARKEPAPVADVESDAASDPAIVSRDDG